MSEFWAQAAALVWGPVTVVLLVGTGIYLSFRFEFTHLMNGLQIFPNLIALIILAPRVAAATRSYFNPTPSK